MHERIRETIYLSGEESIGIGNQMFDNWGVNVGHGHVHAQYIAAAGLEMTKTEIIN